MALLEASHLEKTYVSRFGTCAVQALRDVNFCAEAGDYIAVMGESGSGKTTLLNIIAALDRPTGGSVTLNGKDLAALPDSKLALFRREHLGFVFQDFNLLDTLSLRDNIYLPLVLSGRGGEDMEALLAPLAQLLGITELLKKFPYEVSGGQKQRTAVARALITQPELILADEPTGALDSKSAAGLLRIFARINAAGQTIVMVTHSAFAASRAGRVLFIKDGRVCTELVRGQRSEEAFHEEISRVQAQLTNGGETCA